MTRRSNLTPQQAIDRLRGKRRPLTWKALALLIEQRSGIAVNPGYLNAVYHGQRDASNHLRAALGCMLKPAAAAPCGKRLANGTICLEVHTRGHPREKRPVTSPRVTLDGLRQTHQIEVSANPRGVFVTIGPDAPDSPIEDARRFDSWPAAVHWIILWSKGKACQMK